MRKNQIMTTTTRDESFFEDTERKTGNVLAYALGYLARGTVGFLHWLVIGTLSAILNIVLFIIWRVAILAAIGCGIVAAEMSAHNMTLAAYGFGAAALAFLVARYRLNSVFRPQVVVVHE